MRGWFQPLRESSTAPRAAAPWRPPARPAAPRRGSGSLAEAAHQLVLGDLRDRPRIAIDALEAGAALAAKSGSRGKSQERTCQGLIAASCSQPQIVVAEASVTPRSITSRCSSVRVKRPSGRPWVAGSSQAIALTSATCSGGKTARAPRALQIGESLEPLRAESSPPLADALWGAVEALGDPPVGLAGRGVEDHPCALDLAEGTGLRAGEALQLAALLLTQLDLDLARHCRGVRPQPPKSCRSA
jgi:hypothetical protein